MNHRRSLSLAVTSLCLAATMASSQQSAVVVPPDPRLVTLARHFLTVSGSVQAANALIVGFKQQMASAFPAYNAAAWDSLGAQMQRALPALQDSLAPLYAARFTAEELEGLIAFYESPLGRRFVTQQPALVEGSSAISQRWARSMIDEFTKALTVRPVQLLHQ